MKVIHNLDIYHIQIWSLIYLKIRSKNQFELGTFSFSEFSLSLWRIINDVHVIKAVIGQIYVTEAMIGQVGQTGVQGIVCWTHYSWNCSFSSVHNVGYWVFLLEFTRLVFYSVKTIKYIDNWYIFHLVFVISLKLRLY